ncbi:type I restriction-modification enzyme R subunit C-terminal domain-containing protein [Rhodococcus spongiicola]|uniref:site-specific DNA-methyltransferase (adenine-specific) n=1 Tax=Rhodococcus spongiicola TaxID=2487352 RepID=A0A438AUB3_9NOCA|nr:type I restriction-modification enzyme R subunit C-terminal domain-containing protein [Rhodococcus spongiicola]RVW02284.1 hypothetical protein EF834_11735 [Rhodococcus spongiicola]
MITGEIKSKVDAVGDAFWTGGISDPLEVMEQITYLLFIRRLDDEQTKALNQQNLLGVTVENKPFPDGNDEEGRPYDELRWSRIKNMSAEEAFDVVGQRVFPFIKSMRGDDSTYAQFMKDARLTIPNAGMLQRVIDRLDQVPMGDLDTKGDIIYEYLLAKIASADQNGQFRMPRDIIQLMVEMTAPKPGDTIVDPESGLPTTVRDTYEMVKRFDLMILRGQLAVHYCDDTLSTYRMPIQQIADGLLDEGLNIPKVKAKEALLREVAGDEWWQHVTLQMLEHARRELRSIVGLLYTDFEDTLDDVAEIDIVVCRHATDVERFKAKAWNYLRRRPDNLALEKLRNGKPLTPADLDSLEELLAGSGAGDSEDLERAVENAQGLGRFIRSLVGFDTQAATEAFEEFLHGKTATARQIDFVNLIILHLTRHGEMDPKLLFESPFTDHAPLGPSQVFGDEQAVRLVQVIRSINASVEPAEAATA